MQTKSTDIFVQAQELPVFGRTLLKQATEIGDSVKEQISLLLDQG